MFSPMSQCASGCMQNMNSNEHDFTRELSKKKKREARVKMRVEEKEGAGDSLLQLCTSRSSPDILMNIIRLGGFCVGTS